MNISNTILAERIDKIMIENMKLEHDILQINRKLTKSKTGKNAQNADFSDEKIKRRRKKKIEMVRKFSCPATKCTKTYGFA